MRLDAGQIEVVDDVMAKVLKQKRPDERIGIGFDIWISAHAMLTTHIGRLHPDWDGKKVEQEVARRFLHGSL